MTDEPKAVLAQLPGLVLKHPVKMRELRTQWDQRCAKILQEAKLTPDQRIKVTMDWLAKGGVRDFVLGRLILSFARPLPSPPTEDQKKERRQKSLVKLVYNDDIPHLRAVNKVVADRLDEVPGDTSSSLADLDQRDEREKDSPGMMFAEFARSIEQQAAIEYKPSLVDAAE